MLESSRIVVFPIAFMAIFTAPLVEEVIYRGILYSSLQRKVGIVYAVIIVTLLFGLVHVPQYSKNFSPDFSALIPLFLLSLTLTLIRVRTKNLLPCIVLHTIFNTVGSLSIILEPYLRNLSEPNQTPTAFIFHLFK
ncbi:MAG: CPBP family intramembrane glutamic endopeptidase [Pyrinomonadaceae bacterium]